jgi:serine/threonine-protein kinase
VYRAERIGEYEQSVALKVLRPGWHGTEMVQRFRRERQILARLIHPDIAAILDGGQLKDGRPYLVLQYIDGIPITDYCETSQLDLTARLRLFKRVCDAVQFAHGRMVIHRDLKPSNILITPAGEPRLLDFGIAKLLDPDETVSDAQARTRPDMRLMTPEYAAPEQLNGEPTSAATDGYALGVLLHQLLTGSRPVASSGRTLLRGDLDRIVLMAIRAEPGRRYDSAGALADDIDRHVSGLPVRAQPDSVRYRARKFIRRNRALVASAIVVAMLLIGFSVTSTVQSRRVARERDRAVSAQATADAVIAMLTGLFERSNPQIVPGGDTVRVAALLDEGERRVNELNTEPALQARMWRVLGNMHAARSRFDRAETLLRRAYERQRAIAGENDSTAAQIYHEIARVVGEYRGPSAALPMLDSSIAQLRRTVGPSHPAVAAGLEDRSVVEPNVARRAALLDTATRIRQAQPGVDSMSLAATLNKRGSLEYSQAHWTAARTSFQESLAILEHLLPPDHPNRLTVLSNVIMVLGNIGEFERADSLQHVLLDALRRTVGPTSVSYANALEGAAINALSRGRFADSEAGMRTALATYRQTLTPDHWRIENALRNLGLVIARRGRVDEGLAVFDSALAMHRARNDTSSGELGYLTGQRSYLLLQANRPSEAREAAREAEHLMRGSSWDAGSRQGDLAFWLAMTAFASGDTTSAVSHFTIAHDVYGKTLPATHPSVAMTGCALGAALLGAGRRHDAEPLIREACATHEKAAAPSPIVMRWAREAMATLRRDLLH